MGPPLIPATSLPPSAEQATEDQFVMGVLVCVQVWARPEVATNTKPPEAVAASQARVFMILEGTSSGRLAKSVSGTQGEITSDCDEEAAATGLRIS